MKKVLKSLTTVILAFIIIMVNANVAFAAELFYPALHLTSPEYYNSTPVSLSSLEEDFDTDVFVDYLIEHLKIVDCTERIFPTRADLFGRIDISQFNISASDERWKELTSFLWYNSPELFRLNTLSYYSSNGIITELVFAENYSKENYATMLEQMYNSAEFLLEDVKGNTSLTDVEKALILHDRIALWCEYDNDNYLAGATPKSSHNAYGVLVLKDAVCQGYALAYDYLLEQVGIKSEYCSSKKLNHAWNIVYIDDKPYHVDVTHDDPVYDISGRVTHTNFLRSTEGIKSTGSHTASDFNSTPVDTTYDNYFWQNYNTAFTLLNNKIYIIDSANKNLLLLKTSDGSETEILKNLPYTWVPRKGSYYPNSYSKLYSDGEFLYYNSPDTVFKYNPETNTEEEFFKPDLTIYDDYYWIYGLNANNCKITCEIFNTPNFDDTVKAKFTQSTPFHKKGEWITTKEPTTEEYGEIQTTCYKCKEVLETKQIDKLLFDTKDNSIIDEQNSVIFSTLDICDNIEDLLIITDSVTYNISASFAFDETTLLGTGSVIEIYKDNEKISEHTIIIKGDLNGDSVCDVLDVASAELCRSNNKIPSANECYAANGNASETIDINSLQNVVNTALNRS